ncbi:hypothetical protein [Glycomyces buryatensis]|uniref:Uncharacterized protein n=1 Tax=Glycomyces buryatensis TaxID=2570927 RepID=A0A4V6T6H5_9ACTN|nr:hypothetical protein [Glycomyces buryatensis]THV33406.1 hypothetical protein FAB82_24985 [Glycomyces buryatensis]
MNLVPDVPPQSYALLSLLRAHLKHLDRIEAEPLDSPQWAAAVESPRTVAAVKAPSETATTADVTMIIGTGSPDRRRCLYTAMPTPASVATLADESEVAIFLYNRRGRLQPANRTASAIQSRAWYPPAKAIAPMRIVGDEAWGVVAEATGDSGHPGIFEAAAGWLVLLAVIAFLGAAAYLALKFFGVI